jgi:T4 RnlA family RNA ligase
VLYQFPVITHIDDILPAIEGSDEFIVAEREWGKVVNYMVNMSDTFPEIETINGAFQQEKDFYAAIRRECRGILFYPDGSIMSRRLHKFFNVNERDETAAHTIDLSKPHVIMEKLDGSMITPVFTAAGIRWGTKMGITEVSMQAEEFVARKPQYEEFARLCEKDGLTPIFEWCSRKQRIVVDYPEDRLVLIAIRNTVSGEYLPYHVLLANAARRGIDLVHATVGNTTNMEHLIAETRAMEDAEGWIIRFDDGQMLKIKGDWYVRIHKVKDNLTHEKNVIDLIINEKSDDVKAMMLDEDRKRFEEFESKFWQGFEENAAQMIVDLVEARRDCDEDRKIFALGIATKIPALERGLMFNCWDGDKIMREELLKVIRKNCNTQTKVDKVRHLWGSHRWNYYFDGDA